MSDPSRDPARDPSRDPARDPARDPSRDPAHDAVRGTTPTAPGATATPAAPAPALPPTIARTLERFRAMGREEKMQALVSYARRLEPLPERLRALDRTPFTVPECQTPVDIFPEVHDGRLHFYADVNVRQSPTVAAVLAIVFAAVNDQPPATTLAIPSDFVRTLMDYIGLGAREPGLNALIARLRRHAAEAIAVA